MNKRSLWTQLVLLAAVLLTGCSSRPRVGALQSESRLVELTDARPVRVKIDFGAGNLDLTGGAAKLLEADFTYNVARLKPEVKYTDGTLVVQQPASTGLPVLQNIADFRNDWNLRLYDQVPMDLSVDVGGTCNLKLARLSLNRLDVTLGAGSSTIDLNGDWTGSFDASIDAGAADLTVRLPADVGVRVVVERGAAMIKAPDLTQDADIYTNAAYGAAKVTVHVDLKAGIGRVNLEVIDQ